MISREEERVSEPRQVGVRLGDRVRLRVTVGEVVVLS